MNSGILLLHSKTCPSPLVPWQQQLNGSWKTQVSFNQPIYCFQRKCFSRASLLAELLQIRFRLQGSNSCFVSPCIALGRCFQASTCWSLCLGPALSPLRGARASGLWNFPLPWAGAWGSDVHLFFPLWFCNGLEKYLQRILNMLIASCLPHGVRLSITIHRSKRLIWKKAKTALPKNGPKCWRGCHIVSVHHLVNSLLFLSMCLFAPHAGKIFAFSCRCFSHFPYLCHWMWNGRGRNSLVSLVLEIRLEEALIPSGLFI